VSLFERSFGAVMAAKAKGSLSSYQKAFLVRTMREMAGCTTLLPNFMGYLLLIIFPFVTLKASFVSLCFQQPIVLGGMRIMALNASSSLQGGVDIRFIHPYLIFTVAGIADVISFFFQNQLGHDAVPKMAVLALLVFDRSMNILHCHIFVGKLFVAVEAISAYKFLSCCRCTPQCPFLWGFRTGK
jgi:hypothetical protein